MGTEAKEVGLECRLGGCERAGRGNSLRARILGGDNKEEDEDEEEWEVTPLPHSPSPEDLPHLATSSASK
jgi:hypothetical protein